jgi:hypothetical protein
MNTKVPIVVIAILATAMFSAALAIMTVQSAAAICSSKGACAGSGGGISLGNTPKAGSAFSSGNTVAFKPNGIASNSQPFCGGKPFVHKNGQTICAT